MFAYKTYIIPPVHPHRHEHMKAHFSGTALRDNVMQSCAAPRWPCSCPHLSAPGSGVISPLQPSLLLSPLCGCVSIPQSTLLSLSASLCCMLMLLAAYSNTSPTFGCISAPPVLVPLCPQLNLNALANLLASFCTSSSQIQVCQIMIATSINPFKMSQAFLSQTSLCCGKFRKRLCLTAKLITVLKPSSPVHPRHNGNIKCYIAVMYSLLVGSCESFLWL